MSLLPDTLVKISLSGNFTPVEWPSGSAQFYTNGRFLDCRTIQDNGGEIESYFTLVN